MAKSLSVDEVAQVRELLANFEKSVRSEFKEMLQNAMTNEGDNRKAEK